MDVIRHKYIFLTASGILVLASIISISIWGLKLGIDFTGGSILEIEFQQNTPSVDQIRSELQPRLGTVVVQQAGEKSLLLRFRTVNEKEHQEILKVLGSLSLLKERRFDTIGPTIGAELKRNSLAALGLAVIAIILYIAWAFRQVSKPVSSWKYGAAAVIALVHDITIPAGIFAVLGRFRGVEVDTLFITALLTILGFSVHDTIVVFDRIRENLRKVKSTELFEVTVNRSILQTVARSVNTSLTTVLALTAIFFFGGATVKYFVLAMILGIVFGTYSSIFVASPLLVVWNRLTKKA